MAQEPTEDAAGVSHDDVDEPSTVDEADERAKSDEDRMKRSEAHRRRRETR